MSFEKWLEDLFGKSKLHDEKVSVDYHWYQEAIRHYCTPCERWFGDVRGKLMHDRHRHKHE